MAAKRVTTSSINWAAFAESVPKSDLHHFQALKTKNESYIRRVAVNPGTLIKIDWAYYRSRIAVPGLVDSFQKSYEGLQIPYPSDQGLIQEINNQESTMKDNLVKYCAEIDEKVELLKKELEVLKAQIPFSEMTVEEFFIANPHMSIDPVNNPTLYPHDEASKEYTRKLKEDGKF